MKKFIVLVLVFSFCLLFAACTEKTSSENQNNENAYYIVFNEVTIKLGAKADDVVAALGQPQSKNEIGDCGGLGAQVKYSYPSFDLYVLESKTSGNIIDAISFRDDMVETSEGVCIGMGIDEAKTKLGEPSSSTEKELTYINGKYAIKIKFEDNTVTEIDYITDSTK